MVVLNERCDLNNRPAAGVKMDRQSRFDMIDTLHGAGYRFKE
jgi:hypothetical protein